ncbi:hypothetical protein [Legionella sp. WA2022007384]
MITVKQLKDLLTTSQNQPTIFPSTLDNQTIEVMQQESAYTFSFFTQLTQGKDDDTLSSETIGKIRSYFKDRWATLKKSNLAYTRYPFLPVNQFCLKVAEEIAGPKEAICQILMPGLIGVNRECPSLKFETEVDGHFELENYIINQDYTRLIPVEEIFQTAAINSNHVLADFQPAETTLPYQLGGRDFLNLEQVAGEASTTFIRVLKQHHAQQYDDNSLGFAIKKLATEMRKSSAVDAGNEDWADNEVVADAIKTFYLLWRSLSKDLPLPQEEDNLLETNKLVKDLRLKSYGRGNVTLESYFLAVFVRHKDCPLTEEELKRQQEENIFPCAYQISDCLFEFLVQYPGLYKISVATKEKQTQDLPSLKSLLPKVLEGLVHRPPMLNGDNTRLFERVTKLVLRSAADNMSAAADFIAPQIKSYEKFKGLTDTPALFDAVATRVQSRLAALPFMPGIHQLLRFFSNEQQQLIVDATFEQLIQEYNTPKKYQKLISELHNPAKISFKRKYAERLAASINSPQDFLALQKRVSKDLMTEVFEGLESKYPILLDSYESVCTILLACSSVQQQKVINFIKPHLYEWLNAGNYDSFTKLLHFFVKFNLLTIMSEQIKSKCHSFVDWRKHYFAWKRCSSIQSLLLGQLFSQFKHEIKDSDNLFPLVQETTGDGQLQLIKAFQSLINTKELFEKYLALIPKSSYADYISSIALDSFVSSLSELQEIADCFSSDQLRNSVFAQFNPEKLNCTKEEFALLTQNKFEFHRLEEVAQNFDPKIAIDSLETYLQVMRFMNPSQSFFSAPNQTRGKKASDLINMLKNERLTSFEKIAALEEAKKEIEEEYNSFYTARSSRLYSCICKILDEAQIQKENIVDVSHRTDSIFKLMLG